MRQRPTKVLGDSATTLVSVSELAEIVGVELDTINNWVRHNIIHRARIGGRQLRSRLFSTNEVYKATLTSELVRLGIQPSHASEAANVVWKEWEKMDVTEEQKVDAVVVPTKNKWAAALCSQNQSVGSKRFQMELPKHAFAVIPISDVFERVSRKMSALLGG
jgi:hypothetical protein